jgi:DNA polymerase III subunit gamma/tau
MPLHLDHRPQTLEDFLGNDHVKTSLSTVLANPKRQRVFLLHGHTGCGKTTLARIIANTIGCSPLEVRELDIGDTRGIDAARQIKEDLMYFPKDGDLKVYILDEIQASVIGFQEALLKTLEDTPPHIVFILCTTDPHKLKSTIINRCSSYELMPLPGVLIKKLIMRVLEKEGIDNFPTEAISLLVELSKGCPRDALVKLDQVVDIEDNIQVVETLKKFKIDEEAVDSLARLLYNNAEWKEIIKTLIILKNQDIEKIRFGILGYCNAILLKKDSKRAAMIMDLFSIPMYNGGLPLLTLACYKTKLT